MFLYLTNYQLYVYWVESFISLPQKSLTYAFKFFNAFILDKDKVETVDHLQNPNRICSTSEFIVQLRCILFRPEETCWIITLYCKPGNFNPKIEILWNRFSKLSSVSRVSRLKIVRKRSLKQIYFFLERVFSVKSIYSMIHYACAWYE